MLNATWKSLLARKLRLLLSALSIVLGVAFVAGSLMFTNLLQRSVDEIVKSTVGDVNVVRQGTGFTEFATDAMINVRSLTPDDLELIADVPGLRQVTGVVSSAQVYMLDTDEHLVALQGAPGIGSSWHTTPAADGLTGARVVEGRAPTNAGEVAIDPSTVRRSGHAIGDMVKVATPFADTQQFRLVGTATYGAGATAGSSYLFFTQHDAQRLFAGGQDRYQGVWATVEQGADAAAVAKAVAEVVPPNWEVRTGDELAAEVEELLSTGMGFVTAILLVFAAIALAVASLLIVNTFSILVTQRSRELAMLRAIGATRRQIRRSVLLEALAIGLLGSLLGVAVGYALVWALRSGLGTLGVDLGDQAPRLTVVSVVAAVVVGVGVTTIAALLPALRASRQRPVEALSQAVPTAAPEGHVTQDMLGIVLFELAAALLVCGIFLDVPQPLWWVGAGCGLLLVGAVLAAGMLGRPVLRGSALLLSRTFGEVGALAQRNAQRQPRRTAATAGALMLGLALVTALSVLASSVETSMRTQLTQDQRGDFVIAPVNRAPFDKKVAVAAEGTPGVYWVGSFAPAKAMLGGTEETVDVVGTTPKALLQASPTNILAGTMTAETDSAVIAPDFASRHDLSLGKTFELRGQSGTQRLLVTGIGELEDGAEVVMHRSTLEKINSVRELSKVVVFAQASADKAKLGRALQAATSGQKLVTVSSVDEYVQARIDQVQQIVGLIYGLLGLALIISLLGVGNTLSLSVVERGREIGLLRAVGLTRRQIRRMVSLEAVLITTMGGVTGVLLGLLIGVLVQYANRGAGIGTLDIPWLQLLLFLVVTTLLGWVAAVGPARRAARQPVLSAIADE